MNKCLITKLNSSINDELEVFGAIKIHINNTVNDFNDLYSSAEAKVYLPDGTFQIINTTTPLELPSVFNDYVIFTSKYNAYPTSIQHTAYMNGISGISTQDLKYYTGDGYTVFNLNMNALNGDIKDLPIMKNVKKINFHGSSKINGTYSDIIEKFPFFNALYLEGSAFSGNVEDFGNNINITIIRYASKTVGDLYNFVHKQRENGRTVTETPLLLNYVPYTVTLFDNKIIDSNNIITTKLSWTEDTVTFYNGEAGTTTTYNNSGEIIS